MDQNELSVALPQQDIQGKILTLRNQQVMLDRDLAQLYGVKTMVLNQAVKRNINRFPAEFRFQVLDEELQELITNCDRFKSLKHSPTLPYAFTEQGVAMLSAVLKSETAVRVSVQIMRAFVQMRHFIQVHADVFNELEQIKVHQIKTDIRVDELFTLMDKHHIKETQGVFFQGQIFDAYAKFESFIQSAKKEIVLIDNYVDLSVLERLTAKGQSVAVTIITGAKSKLRKEDIACFNQQYPNLKVKYTDAIHDRFLIIDNTILYHIGASLKDLGKKCFAFEILDSSFIQQLLA